MACPTLRRTMFALLVATGPLGMGCELVFDFDRTPLQPVYEAGAPEAGPGATGPKDASSDRAAADTAPPVEQRDATPTVDAADTGTDDPVEGDE
jgi:hypothetical protein